MITRYDIYISGSDEYLELERMPDPEGEWVKFEDIPEVERKAYKDAVNESIKNVEWAWEQYVNDKEDTPEVREALLYIKYLLTAQVTKKDLE